jgi:hypothetical protein
MLSVILQSAIMMNVIMMSVVMLMFVLLNAMEPLRKCQHIEFDWENNVFNVDVLEWGNIEICGLHYKHVTIVNDDSSIVTKWSSKLIDAARGVIYNRHMFILQATGEIYEVFLAKLAK